MIHSLSLLPFYIAFINTSNLQFGGEKKKKKSKIGHDPLKKQQHRPSKIKSLHTSLSKKKVKCYKPTNYTYSIVLILNHLRSQQKYSPNFYYCWIDQGLINKFFSMEESRKVYSKI